MWAHGREVRRPDRGDGGQDPSRGRGQIQPRSGPHRQDRRQAPHGFDDALDRAKRFAAAGADVLFVEALTGRDEIERVAKELSGIPLVFNWVEGGKTPPLSHAELAELGYRMIIMPIGTLLAATQAMQRVLASIREHGTPLAALDDLPAFADFTELIGVSEIEALEAGYAG